MPVIVGIIPSEVLNNAIKIPVLGLGSLNCFDEAGSTTQSVKDAIDLGYRHFDINPKIETDVGVAISAKIKEGVVKREELYLVGKLYDTKAFHNPALLKEAVMTTLRNLNVAYIDMYFIHCPEGDVFSGEAFTDTWNELEILVDNFVVKSIGLSNFSVEQLQNVLIASRVSPTVNQIECNPYFTQRALREFCAQKRILISALNIFGTPALLEDPLIVELAKKYKRTPELILLRYQIEKGHIAVAEVQNKSDLMSHLDAFKFEINNSDISEMDKLDRHKLYI
ncbi:aldo-keto reductase family 1 member B1-like [Bradysia coprophila]|uniref:aldo-keto reductase family 1 member B1-like n=1 Tax=Bradysia coprophila TaxID=38358 RepID=UPI00187D93C1|nr:aldo-keto reductase family 1 member B1-like [Bradysia coprophila]